MIKLLGSLGEWVRGSGQSALDLSPATMQGAAAPRAQLTQGMGTSGVKVSVQTQVGLGGDGVFLLR